MQTTMTKNDPPDGNRRDFIGVTTSRTVPGVKVPGGPEIEDKDTNIERIHSMYSDVTVGLRYTDPTVKE